MHPNQRDVATPGAAAAKSPSSSGLQPYLPFVALFAVQLTFSGFHVIGKIVLETLPPLALAASRVLLATPLLIAVAWRVDHRPPPKRWLPHLVILGMLGVFINQVLFVLGLRYTSATNAAILMPSIPVFAAGIGWLTGIERIGRRRLSGVLFAAAGALAVLDPRRFSFEDASFLGTLLILVNCLSYSFFLVLQRPLLFHLPWRSVIAWSFLFGGIGVLVVGGPALVAVDLSTIPAAVWWGVLYIGLFPTFLGYLLNTWAVRRSSSTLAAAFTSIQPLLTALLALVWLDERPSSLQALGFVLIVTGLWLVSWRRT